MGVLRRIERGRQYAPRILVAAAIGCAGLAGATHAGEVDVKTSLTVKETYTDNIALDPPGAEEDDLVTEINPEISASASGGRVEAALNYRLQNLFYREDRDRNRSFHQLRARSTTELIKKFFFLDATAFNAQTIISPDDKIAVSNAAITTNRTDIRTVAVSPYAVKRFGSTAELAVRYKVRDIKYTEDPLRDRVHKTTSAVLSNGPRFRRLGWRMSYQRRNIERENLLDINFLNSELRLSYGLTPNLEISGTGGYENNDLEEFSFAEEPEGAYWNIGASWNASPRTRLGATVGERYFGKTGSLDIEHRSRSTRSFLRYNERLTTSTEYLISNITTILGRLTEEDRDTDLSETLDTTAPSALLSTIRSRRTDAGLSIDSAKSEVRFRLFYDERLFEENGDQEEAYGGAAQWRWLVAGRTSSSIGFDWHRRQFAGSERVDDLFRGSISLSRDIGRSSEGAVGYMYFERDSNIAGGGYTQNAVFARLTITV